MPSVASCSCLLLPAAEAGRGGFFAQRPTGEAAEEVGGGSWASSGVGESRGRGDIFRVVKAAFSAEEVSIICLGGGDKAYKRVARLVSETPALAFFMF
jgi:hypothetical protein